MPRRGATAMKLRGLTMRMYMIGGWLLALTVSACGSVTARSPDVDANADSASDVRKSGEAGSGGGGEGGAGGVADAAAWGGGGTGGIGGGTGGTGAVAGTGGTAGAPGAGGGAGQGALILG